MGKQPAPLPKDHADALTIMAVGQQVPYTKVRIADDDDQELPENHVGHILISGDNVTKGYFENPEANAKGFTAPDSNESLAAHRRSRNDAGRQAVHHRPREGNHLRQRPELLPARHREHRDPRRRPRARQGGGGGRAAQGREHRRSHPLRAASHGHEGVPAHRRRRSRGWSTNTRDSKWRTWCR